MAEGISLWDGSAVEAVPELVAALPERVELAIVGGGFTGLSTALHAAEAGVEALVLEAQALGAGGSGRNVGLVNAGIWLPPREVRAKLGAHADGFLQRFGDGPRLVFDLVERHQIRCEAVRSGTLHAAHAPAGMEDLRARAEDWQAMGAPVRLLSRGEAAEKIGSQAFHGALLDSRCGTINPMGYTRGLARAAHGAGARIASGVTVTGLRREAGMWRVATTRGVIRAGTVVLGTNAYTDPLWPGLDASYTPIHYFQFATAPLGPEASHILPERQGVWDTGRIMISVRRDVAGRLILGSMGRVIGDVGRGLSRRWAARTVQRLFPELGAPRFEDAWHGRIAMTSDHIPRIHQPAKRLYAPTAYNGRGITTGTIFGQAIAALLTGAPPDTLPLPVTRLAREPAAALKARVFDLGFTANQIWRSL